MNPSFVRPLPILPPLSTCTLCSLHGVAQSIGISLHHLPFSLPPSPTNPILLIIGQNPGIHEDRASTPFLGKSGHILQFAYIRAHGLHELATIYVTNICRCYHRDGDGPTNTHYKACRPHLLTDLHHLLGQFDGRGPASLTLLTLGAPATTHTYALLGRPRVTLTSAFAHQGSVFPVPSPPESVTSTPEPMRGTERGRGQERLIPHQGATFPCPSPPPSPSRPPSERSSPTPLSPPPTPGCTSKTSGTSSTNSSIPSPAKKPTRTKTPTTTSASTPPIPSPTTTTTTDLTIFSSFHPAAVDRSNNLIHAVSGHLTLLRAHLTGRMPVPSTPLILSPRGPTL